MDQSIKNKIRYIEDTIIDGKPVNNLDVVWLIAVIRDQAVQIDRLETHVYPTG